MCFGNVDGRLFALLAFFFFFFEKQAFLFLEAERNVGYVCGCAIISSVAAEFELEFFTLKWLCSKQFEK